MTDHGATPTPDVEVLDDGSLRVRTSQGSLVISQRPTDEDRRTDRPAEGEEGGYEQSKREFRQRFRELLEELRVVLPGIQVLFAFLLTVPFSSRFPKLDRVELIGFAIALGAAGLGSLLLMAPTIYHRIDRRRDRAQRVRASVVYLVGGALFSGLAICAGVFVVARFVYGPPAGLWSSSALGAVLVATWIITPLVRRR